MSAPATNETPVTFAADLFESADVHASSDEYAARFGGPVGQWMLEVQEQAVHELLDEECGSVLDVGGGHGQIALPLARAQRAVTVLGSAPICAQRLHDHIENGLISFKCGNLVQLPFEDQSFNLVVSFRLMSHCTAWRTLIEEMCRTSSHAVIIDYPVWCSVNFLSPLMFFLKKSIEGNTRTFKVFSTYEIVREFRKHGFKLELTKRQFACPMALHRAVNNPSVSRILCRAAQLSGLTKLFGSPVIAKFVRE